MAAIENSSSSNEKKIHKVSKHNTRVDLTPMVDLGFLLITFFVFTTTMAASTVMNIHVPDDKLEPDDPVCASCVLTIFLDENNNVKYFEGMPASHPEVKVTNFSNDGVRKVIVTKRQAVEQLKGSADDFVMIIKPGIKSTFQNFIDIVDEATINNVKHYYCTEITKEDMLQLHVGP